MCQCLCSREARAIPEYYFALIISIDANCYFVADSIFYHLSVTVLFLSLYCMDGGDYDASLENDEVSCV